MVSSHRHFSSSAFAFLNDSRVVPRARADESRFAVLRTWQSVSLLINQKVDRTRWYTMSQSTINHHHSLLFLHFRGDSLPHKLVGAAVDSDSFIRTYSLPDSRR